MTHKYLLAIVGCLLLAGCAGMSAVETTGVAVTGAGALVTFVEALRPMLSPTQAAHLTLMAGNVQTVVEATAAALGTMATAVDAQQATEWSGGEIVATATGTSGVALAASRALSLLKHKSPAS